jgi:hypothetical protein
MTDAPPRESFQAGVVAPLGGRWSAPLVITFLALSLAWLIGIGLRLATALDAPSMYDVEEGTDGPQSGAVDGAAVTINAPATIALGTSAIVRLTVSPASPSPAKTPEPTNSASSQVPPAKGPRQMAAFMTGPASADIQAAGPARQTFLASYAAAWTWRVTPATMGRLPLQINLYEKNNGSQYQGSNFFIDPNAVHHIYTLNMKVTESPWSWLTRRWLGTAPSAPVPGPPVQTIQPTPSARPTAAAQTSAPSGPGGAEPSARGLGPARSTRVTIRSRKPGPSTAAAFPPSSGARVDWTSPRGQSITKAFQSELLRAPPQRTASQRLPDGGASNALPPPDTPRPPNSK